MKIAVFDKLSSNRALIQSCFLAFSIKYNMDFDAVWFSDGFSENLISKYALDINLAYISLLDTDGLKIGEVLYDKNPDCLICYYYPDKCELVNLLHTRPFHFEVFPTDESSFIAVHNELIKEVLSQKRILTIDTRKRRYNILYRNILYIRSDLKYVDIFISNGSFEHIFYKLSDLEKQLNRDFIRIHKSYIVNANYVAGIDKAQHSIHLCDDTVLPISSPYYKTVLESLTEITHKKMPFHD